MAYHDKQKAGVVLAVWGRAVSDERNSPVVSKRGIEVHHVLHTRYGQASPRNGEWRGGGAELKKFCLMCRGLEGVMTLSILSTSGRMEGNIQHDWSLFPTQLRLRCGGSGYYMIRD